MTSSLSKTPRCVDVNNLYTINYYIPLDIISEECYDVFMPVLSPFKVCSIIV